MDFSPRTVDRRDESGNQIAHFAVIPREMIEANDWGCCRAADKSGEYPEVLDDQSALIPILHWFDHELGDLSNSELAEILTSPVIGAGAIHSDGTFPVSTELDMRTGTERQIRARQVLVARGLRPEDVNRIDPGGYWPED